ncbi:MAG: hypothetical protein RL637_520 [Pseudomonadota bacterium]|jgi:predicted nucleotidyltransferase
MRLSDIYCRIIKNEVKQIFGDNSQVFLFGSRVDDTKKGGDIDLYIETQNHYDIFNKKIELLARLQQKLGEQQIDIVVNDFTQVKTIYTIAKNSGILL